MARGRREIRSGVACITVRFLVVIDRAPGVARSSGLVLSVSVLRDCRADLEQLIAICGTATNIPLNRTDTSGNS
jgi:hypothetical protein